MIILIRCVEETGSKPYGQVRWMGQSLGIDGSRQAENLNNNYFEHGRHTPMAVIIKGEMCIRYRL